MATAFSDNENIISGVSIRSSIDDIATVLNYAYRYSYTLGLWSMKGVESDPTQSTAFGKTYIQPFEMRWVRDEATAKNVVERQLERQKKLRMEASFETILSILTNDLLGTLTIDHYNGPTLETLTINQLTINLDTFTVGVVAKTESVLTVWDDTDTWTDTETWTD